jgi:tripartite ATP-independent transporter DctM subunit
MIVVLLVSLLILIILEMPVAYAIVLSSVFAILSLGASLPLTLIVQMIFNGIDSFPLMCIPFFVLAGEFMSAGNISQKLIDVANVFVGRIRGGLAHVNILASMLFGGVSGSATADVSSIGTILIPTMNKAGYHKDFSVAVTATSATIGIIIPPSNAMIVYAMIAGNVSISGMFLAGIIPGILVGLSLMTVAYYISVKRGYQAEESKPFKEVIILLLKGIVPLFTFVIILGGILGGIFTPTESAVVAAFYAFVISVFVYKSVKFKDIPKMLYRSALTTSAVLFLIGASSIFGFLLAYAHVPQTIADFMFSVTSSKTLLLLIMFAIFLLVGTIMDLTPALIIFVPIFLPIAMQLGMNGIQFGIFIIMALAIGLYTPPVGAVLFITCGIADLSIQKAVKAILPFMAAMIVIVLMVMYIPSLTMAIPNMFK